MNSLHHISLDDIRAVVAIDFGTTYSGFAYANTISSKNKKSPEIELNTTWPGSEEIKTNTVLLYDNGCRKVLKWGKPALTYEKKKIKNSIKELGSPLPSPHPHVVERFKLYLDDKIGTIEKPLLPPNLNYKKAIIDYLRKMKEIIEETLDKRWPDLKLTQVLFVLCVPAEWGPHTKAIMRDCAYKAELLNESIESHLEFTTEPEAAALHCLSNIQEHGLTVGDTFLVVDSGGGTVDLTMRTIQMGNKLKEETERTGDLCGGTFVDQEFINFIGRTVGFNALQKFRTYAYGELQKLVHTFFCKKIKHDFTGDPDKFEFIELDLEYACPSLIKYITGAERISLENSELGEWVIRFDFATVKKMFDPAIEKIIRLITKQLEQLSKLPIKRKCKAMFLVGGFSESKYLIKRVRERFQRRVPYIASPRQPQAAIVKGAVAYGLNMDLVESRVLKWTYGVQGTNVSVNQTFCKEYKPLNPNQAMAEFRVYITAAYQPEYINNVEMRLLGTLKISLSKRPTLGRERPVEFGLTFGMMEIKATARNKLTNEEYPTTFELDISN
ncbi:20547_t:CDS:2 [Dentiscutata erythropus]|uniref:20547_t:CDS:1 n=1 Tax=Dentiscutata erythropus TaxID=1348616 RepID=A0A9N9A1D0_9GLOM|nr:20547_t:CDS:2 [Dentiscutata erythropus]